MTDWVMSRAVWGVVALAVWCLCDDERRRRKERRAREEKKAELKLYADCAAMLEAEKKKLVRIERLLDQERQYTAKLKADADRAARSWCRMYYGAGPADCELCLHREPGGSCEYRVGRLWNG
jgi:hypothetical protein